MGSQQGARPTYIPLVPSPLCSCPSLPITPLHPRLIWQQRWRRAGVRVTEGRCSSSNITLIRLFPCLVTLPSLLSLSSRSILCLCFNSPPPPLSSSHRVYNRGDARHIVIFIMCSTLFCFFLSELEIINSQGFFSCIWTYLKFENTSGITTKTNPASYADLNVTLLLESGYLLWCLTPWNPVHSLIFILFVLQIIFHLNLSSLTFLTSARKEEKNINVAYIWNWGKLNICLWKREEHIDR